MPTIEITPQLLEENHKKLEEQRENRKRMARNIRFFIQMEKIFNGEDND